MKGQKGMKLRHWRWFWLSFCLGIVGVFVVWACVPFLQSVEIIIGLVTLVCGINYFLLQRHLEEARFFKELVTEFNGRYDKQNNTLLVALENDGPFEQKQKQAFIDYFNLCAEEFLFYEVGYIYERVWEAWYNGMKQFGRDPRITELWLREIQTDSYYGFEFPIDGKNKVNNFSGAE